MTTQPIDTLSLTRATRQAKLALSRKIAAREDITTSELEDIFESLFIEIDKLDAARADLRSRAFALVNSI